MGTIRISARRRTSVSEGILGIYFNTNSKTNPPSHEAMARDGRQEWPGALRPEKVCRLVCGLEKSCKLGRNKPNSDEFFGDPFSLGLLLDQDVR